MVSKTSSEREHPFHNIICLCWMAKCSKIYFPSLPTYSELRCPVYRGNIVSKSRSLFFFVFFFKCGNSLVEFLFSGHLMPLFQSIIFTCYNNYCLDGTTHTYEVGCSKQFLVFSIPPVEQFLQYDTLRFDSSINQFY